MKILYLVPHVPNPTKARSWYHIRGLLEAGHQVMVATLERGAADAARLKQLSELGVGIISARISRIQMALNATRTLTSWQPLQADLLWSDALLRAVIDYVRREQPDIIHVEHLRMAKYGLWLRELRPVIWDAVDYLAPLFAQAATNGQGMGLRLAARIEATRLPAYERWLTEQFSRTLVITGRDRQLMSQDNPYADRIQVAPPGLPINTLEWVERESHTLIMTGTLNYHPNVASVHYFVERIWPDLRRTHPLLRLQLVGAHPTPAIQALASTEVKVTGFVPSVMDYLQKATIAVAPVQYGAGIQNKVLEAFLTATPVVASPEGLAGLEAQDGEHLLVADSPEDFAAAVSRLLDDPALRARIGAAGRAYIETHHDLRLTTQALVAQYEAVMSQG
ncbi:MAG: glycosyltransferase [Anaerolineae bacterium]|nr:glycosyltransferase [Anaerolineae bacterium]